MKECGGLMGAAARFIFGQATKPSAALSLASSISLMTALFGRHWATRRFGSSMGLTFPNTYVIGLAPSGVGKTDAAKRAMSIHTKAAEIGCGHVQIPQVYGEDEESHKEQVEPISQAVSQVFQGGKLHSYGGLHNELLVSPHRVLFIDEVNDFFSKVMDSKGSATVMDLRASIKDLFSSADGRLSAELKADKSTRKSEVINPHFSILGMATGKRFWEAVPLFAYQDGTMGRMIILEEQGYPERRRNIASSDAVETEIVRQCAEIIHHRVTGNPTDMSGGGYVNPTWKVNPTIVPRSPAAEAIIEGMLDWTDEQTKRAHHGGRDDAELWNRFVELGEKVALLHALGRNWRNPIVDEQDVIFGFRLVRIGTTHMAKRAGEDGLSDDPETIKMRKQVKQVTEVPLVS